MKDQETGTSTRTYEPVSRELPEYSPESTEPTMHDHSLEGYIELRDNLTETTRAANIDFYYDTITNVPREEIEQRAADGLANINSIRERQGKNPINPDTASEELLIHLIAPTWKDHYPKDDSPEEIEKWEKFKSGFSESIQLNLEEMRSINHKISVLSTDEKLQEEFNKYSEEKREVTAITAHWRAAEKQVSRVGKQIADIRMRASASRRQLTVGEKKYIDLLNHYAVDLEKDKKSLIKSKEIGEKVADMLCKIKIVEQKYQLEHGLLMDNQMEGIISEALPALSRGEPVLLVGETGGAKTALAKFISTEYFGVEPEFISGYSDANSYQLMGKDALRSEDGATVSEFVSGPIVRAMEKGAPLILDEMNAMSPGLLKRLNSIIQLRPGDTFKIQEDSGKEIIIKPGFCIIATGNEKSKRYKAVEDLSTEFQNRFGANIYRVKYPDSQLTYSQPPIENYTLALATVSEANGDFPDEIDQDELYNFVNAARFSQQIFSGEHGEGYLSYVDTERISDGKPGLEETVLAPRTMVDILKKVVESHGQLTIKHEVIRFIEGIKNPVDRQVMIRIFKGHKLLDDEPEDTVPAAAQTT